MAEWSKAHAWKACWRHKRHEGSNPSFSANFVNKNFFLILTFNSLIKTEDKP